METVKIISIAFAPQVVLHLKTSFSALQQKLSSLCGIEIVLHKDLAVVEVTMYTLQISVKKHLRNKTFSRVEFCGSTKACRKK